MSLDPDIQAHDAAVLSNARQHAAAGRFQEMLLACQSIVTRSDVDIVTLLDANALLFGYGFLTMARTCLEKVLALTPNDLRAWVNLANIAGAAGLHDEALRRYAELQRLCPDHPVIRRNLLTHLEYHPSISDRQRLEQAIEWGRWAVARAGGWRPRPAMSPLHGRSLRLGYVSADFCQHTVGLFVREVLKAHPSHNVSLFAYSAGQVQDDVTQAIREVCTWRDVTPLDDAALATQIRDDAIDVLIDLSGHTAGSRLTVFAHRPAPVQVSWLGYFATTGLSYMDAVLLDDEHAPPEAEQQFVEPIIRLPSGRFCYAPLPWMASISTAQRMAHPVTFGCFNNTAKLNEGVFDVWARILTAVPEARLILKWRTFNDETLREQTLRSFGIRGIQAERIELRGPSFHVDLLSEYADIDIALDPFPFTGGLTSCEALYMGVPVVTWPQSRVVSRQTHAFLNQIGLPELSARDAEDYVRIAVELAHDRERRAHLHATLRDKMQTSALMDVTTFTRQLENTLRTLHERIRTEDVALEGSAD